MKIISKFKDFYDYYFTDYDADLVYNRQANNIIFDSSEYDYDKWYLGLPPPGRGYWSKGVYYDQGERYCFDSLTIGIYPYLYKIPCVFISSYKYDPTGGKILFPKAELLDQFKEEKDIKILEKYLKSKLPEEDIKLSRKNHSHFYSEEDDWFKPKRIEKPEYFFELGSPVYMERIKALMENSPYRDLLYDFSGSEKTIYGIKDICFDRLSQNPFGIWNDIIRQNQTYLDIESFLAQKKERSFIIPEPEDILKVEIHGFDKKTSFRKL